MIIKRQEKQDNTLDYQGTPKITTTKVTTGYDAKTVKDNADAYGSLGSQLHLIRVVLPPISLVLGLLLLVAGFVVSRRQPAPATGGGGGHSA